MLDSIFSSVFATTTAAVTHQVSTNMPYLWTFQIALGVILLVASVVVGIFWRRKRRGRRR